MVASITKKTFSLAISLLVVVISLTGVAMGAGAPVVSTLTRHTPGFAGAPGKMARDAAGNIYVTDFWGKGIVKLNSQGSKVGFIATTGRPTAVAVLKDNRLVVAMTAPQPKIAFYRQSGLLTSVVGEEDTVTTFGTPAEPLYRPVAITTDNSANEYIYVVDAGDSSDSESIKVPKVRVYGSTGQYAGQYLYSIGLRTPVALLATTITSDADARMKQPAGIAYEKNGNKIYVVDTLNGRLLLFSAYDGVSMKLVPSTGYIGRGTGIGAPSLGSNPVTFGNPVDVAFEYDGTPLSRIYVSEKGRNEISVLDATTNRSTMYINGTTVSGADLRFPYAVLFVKTATGGVLYATSAATSTVASVMPFSIGIGGGPIPEPSVVLSISPVPLPNVISASLTVSGNVSPVNSVYCNVNGGTDTLATPSGSTWAVDLSLASGDNYILCKSTGVDAVTAYAEARTYFTGSLGTAPTVSIASLGTYTKNASVIVSGTLSGSNYANATVSVANAQGGTAYTAANSTGAWSALVSLAAGSNVVTVSAWKPGTATGSAEVTVIRDNIDPVITVAFVGNDTVVIDTITTNDAVQNVDGVVTEASLASIEVNGMLVPLAAQVALGSDIYFSMPVVLVRGVNTVTVKATDLAGNFNVTSRKVTLKPELAGLTVDFPGDNSWLPAAGSVNTSGTAGTGFTLVNAYAVSDGTWSGSRSAASGLNELLFTASGGGNEVVTVKRSVSAKATYAQLAITSPSADWATNSNSVVISGNIAAGTADAPTIVVSGDATATISSSQYTPASGVFSHTVTFPSEGVYSVKITAGTTTAMRNIIYDNTLPELTLQADSKPMPTTVAGVIESSAKISAITATINSAPFSLPLSSSTITFDPYSPATGEVVWHANLAGYPYDANSLMITTVDPAGNEKQLAYSSIVPTGDVDNDGVVRLADALAALRHVVGTQLLDDEAFSRADVGSLVEGRAGRDGVVDITDSVLILNKAYGLKYF